MVVDEGGKSAATRWKRLGAADGQTLVEFRPLSGRTHQIRVHAARGLGAAIVGDPVYSMPDDAKLGDMTEPKEAIDVTAPVPDRFGRWLDFLP